MSSPAVSESPTFQQRVQKSKQYLAERPTEGCKLGHYKYHFEMLEPEMVAKVSVPFAQINLEVESLVTPLTNEADQNHPHECRCVTTSKLNSVLDEYGFAIIPDILSSGLELETMRSLFAQDLLSIIAKPPISNAEKFADVAADPINHWPSKDIPLGHTFCSDFGLVHGRLAWHVRAHPKIKQAFSCIYDGEQDLCAGTDNLFFSNQPGERPLWEIEKDETGDTEQDEAAIESNSYGEDLWPHVDQNMQELPSGAWRIFQSALYVNPTSERTSSTVLWPKSHREVTEKMFYEGKYIGGHYCPIPNSVRPAFIRHCRRIPVPAGGLLIWNSRTVHQGWNNGPRLAVPVCLEPKSRRDEKALIRKKAMVLRGQPSTHWASLGVYHDLGFRDKPLEKNGLMVLARAHRFLFQNAEKEGDLPPEILDLL